MRKLKLFFACLLMAVLSIGQVWADEAAFSYSDLSGQGGSGSGAAFTGATKDDITMSGYGNGNTSYVQIYANGTLTFTPLNGATITKIVLEATTSGYVKTWSSSPSGVSVDDKYVTWEGSSTSVVTLTNTASGQARIKNMTVTYTAGTPAEPHTVSFSTGAGNPAVSPIAEVTGGAGITLPAGPTPACSAAGWEFAGWAAAAVASETTTAPTLLSGTYHPTEDCTLFAVYKRTEAGSGSTTKSMTSFDAISGNVENDENVSYAAAQGTSSTAPAVNSEQIRIYQNGGLLTITANNGVKLNSITIGSGMVTKVTYAVDGGAASGDNDIAKNGTFTVDELDATEVVFTCTGTDKNSRLYLNNLSVTYSGGGTTYYLSAPSCCTPHAITIATGIENGSVTADPTSACEDATVTLTFTPAGGYHLDSWSVNGTEQDVAENTFTMPATAVTVSATFVHDDCTNLLAPTLDGVTKTYNSATIAWNEVTDAVSYAVSVVKDGEAEPVFSGNVNALSKALENLEPETQYNYTIMAIGDGTVKCADGNGLLEGNFTTSALPQVQLWLVEKQGESAKNGGTHALGVEFDIPASTLECSKVFRGWTTEAYKDYTHATDAPAVLMNKYTFESETAVTLYAVYADETPGAATLTKLGSGATFADGDKLVIAAKGTNFGIYFENAGGSYVKNWEFEGEDPVLSELADAKKILTLKKSGDNWKFGDATNGYFYSSSSNNLEISTTNSSEFNSFSWNNTESAFTITKTDGRYLNCRTDLTSGNANLWRFNGTNTNSGSPFLNVYKYALSASTFSNYATTCSNLLDNPTFSLDPVVAPVNDKYEEAINVVITNNAGEGTIYYTTNGENPTSASDEYTDPITLNTCGTKTIKAIVISATNHSEVVTATYEMAIPIPSVSAEDPYTEAEAVEVYDSGCYDDEDVWVTGTVQTAQFYSSNTYTITLTSGYKFYKFYDLNGAEFTEDYIEVGDVLVAKGKLSKYNTTYQLAEGCYLVSRTPASKTPIDSDIDNPISVAAAINYIDNAATYDLSEDEFVAGIVESIAECPQHEGTYDIIVLDATDNTKQMKFFGCDVKTFTGIKQYDQITGKGKLFKYNSIYELNYPCAVVALTPYVAPVVAVTGVEVDATASVQVGKTVQLTANVLPEGATNKNVTWSVKVGGEDYAEVSATGLVTGKAEGEAIIVVTTEDGSFTDECTVTINPVPYWATVYTSNVAFVGGGDYYETGSKVIINEVQYDAQKVGSSSNSGTITVTVPAYTNTLHFHVFTWNNQTVTLNVTSEDVTNLSAAEISVAGDPAGSGSKTYTINSNPVDHYQYITFDPVATEAQITFSRKEGDKRFIMYGINQVGGVLPELDHIVITGTATALEYEVGDVFIPAGLGVDAYYTLAGTPIAEPEHLVVDENWSGWSVDPAILTGETTSVTVTATYEGKQANKDVNVTVNVPATPEILASPASINFGTVNQNAAVDAQGISVTLKAVAAATVTLAGDGAVAFSIDKAALTELNSTITVTPVTTATGTFAATVTISDDADAADDVVINLSMKVEAVEDLSGTWVLASSVAAGDKIIIMGANNADIYTMGKQNANNRAAVESSLAENVLTPGAATKVFTLVDAGDGKFAIQASNGNYLTSATSGTSNNLLEAADYDLGNAKWTISIEEGIASIVAAAGSKTVMQYNSGSTIFSCYGSANQKPVKIFKREAAPEPPTPSYTEVRNGLTEGWYYTMCLDKAVTAVKAGSIWRVLSKAANGNDVILEEAELPLVAGRPYIFRAAANTLEVAYTGDAVGAPVTEGNNGLVGSFSQVKIANVNTNYIIYNNELYYVNTDNVYVGEHRAYIDMTDVPDYSEPQQGNAPRRRVTMHTNAPQVATGMDALDASEKPVKMVINGQLFILRGEKMYNVNGQLVK